MAEIRTTPVEGQKPGTSGLRKKTRVFMQKAYDSEVGSLRLASHHLSRVIVQLVNNAIESVLTKAEEVGEHFEPYVWIGTKNEDHAVAITVRDNGTGIRPEHEDKIFNPFFTTRPQGSGNIGLGLYLSYDIVVHQHHGQLILDNSPGQGCTFKVLLPKDPAGLG